MRLQSPFRFVLVCLTLFLTAEFASPEYADDVALDTATLLQKAFGLRRSPQDTATGQFQVFHHATPRFMQELYDAVADDFGYTRAATPYDADTVWGMMNLDLTTGNTFWFNLSGLVESNSQILDAELHLFRMRPRLARVNRLLSSTPLLQIRVYQILSRVTNQKSLQSQVNNSSTLRLVATKAVQPEGSGWEVFRVSTTVQDWLQGNANLGFFVVAFADQQQTPFENQNVLKFVQMHEEKQPCLVVFSSSNAVEQQWQSEQQPQSAFNLLRDSYTPENEWRLKQLYEHEFRERLRQLNAPILDESDEANQALGRNKRAVRRPRSKSKLCRLERMFVNFTVLGWDKWIISPKAYDAHVCRGDCTYPIGHHMNATNHAIVQSLLAATRRSGVPAPCCVPGQTKSLSLLYYEDTNVVLRRYDDMIAHSCVCR